MKTDQIIDAIGEIDEELVVSALETRQGTETAVQKQTVSDGAPAGAKKKKKKWFIIPTALAAVFALFLIIMPGGMGSTTNQKYVVPISDSQIYFTSHSTRFRQEALCLYDTETGKTTRILNNTIALKTASGIIGFNRADGSIYKLSGEQAEKIGEAKSDIKWMDNYAFAGDELYFLYSWKAVCKENIKTGQVTELVRRENKFGYNINPVSGEATTVTMAVTTAENVYNSWGLYVTDSGLFYVDIRTGLYYWPFGADQPVHIDK